MVVERKDAQVIRRTASLKSGFTTLQKNATDKIIKGITTIEEVLRVTQKDVEE